MEFRLSRDEEYTRVRQLWVQAFGDEQPWTDWYFSQHYRADKTWVGVENGKVLAQAHLLPHRLKLRGEWRNVDYFVGVCVEETLRGAGIGRELMAAALAELKRTGVGLSVLQPRWPDFYRKLGWNYGYSRRKYSLTLAEARPLFQDVPPLMDWSVDRQESSTLTMLYDSFTHSRHGYALRGRQDWDKLLTDHCGDGGRVGIVSEKGFPVGYVLYKIFGKVLRVRELVWSDVRMVDVAWKHMIRQAEQDGVESLEWEDPAGDPVSVMVEHSHSEPFLMGRVTELQAVVAALQYPENVTAELTLRVRDPLLSWNQGVFRWSIREGTGVLTPLPSADNPGFSMDIGTFSQLIFGEVPVSEILGAGTAGINHEEIKVLERIFPVCRNYISEYF